MTTPEGLKSGLLTIRSGINAMAAGENIKADLSGSVQHMFLGLEVTTKLHNDLGTLYSTAASDRDKFENDIRVAAHEMGKIKGPMEVLTMQRGQDREGTGAGKGWNVLDSKAIANMKMLGADKSGFRSWREKLVNIMEQMRPGSRGIMKALARHVDNEEDIYKWMQEEEGYDDLEDPEKTLEMNTYMLFCWTNQNQRHGSERAHWDKDYMHTGQCTSGSREYRDRRSRTI